MEPTPRDRSVDTTTSAAIRLTGRVIKRPEAKAFLFIEDDQGREYFAHRSAMARDVFQGLILDDRVTFTPVVGPKGFRALDVRAVEE
jgi:cold shock CspA family protein